MRFITSIHCCRGVEIWTGDYHTPWGKFLAQRRRAKARGISWELTFEQWVDWWGQDLHQRGVKSQEFCMGRKGDTGPYSLDNIKKITTRQNIMEGLLKNS